jgi:adenosine deaminase
VANDKEPRGSAEPQTPGATGDQISFESFVALPKTDLHVHLDGSLRLQTILDLAQAENIDLGATTARELKLAIGCGRHFGSLVEYLRKFHITLQVMQTEVALERVAFELAEDAHLENVRYMEVRYAPMLHTERGL